MRSRKNGRHTHCVVSEGGGHPGPRSSLCVSVANFCDEWSSTISSAKWFYACFMRVCTQPTVRRGISPTFELAPPNFTLLANKCIFQRARSWSPPPIKHKTVKRGWFLCFAFGIIAAQARARFYALKQSEGTNDSNRQIKEARHRDHSQSSYAASHIFTLSGLRCSFFRLRISRVERWGIKNNNK